MSNNPEIAARQVYNYYRVGARRRQHKFNLTFGQFYKLIIRPCYICKSKPNRKRYSSQRAHYILAHGIDRVNSNLGYTTRNCKPCCDVCNYMKKSMSLRDFKKHIAKIVAANL